MLAGNWKTSRMVAHYSAGATAERGAVARYLYTARVPAEKSPSSSALKPLTPCSCLRLRLGDLLAGHFVCQTVANLMGDLVTV